MRVSIFYGAVMVGDPRTRGEEKKEAFVGYDEVGMGGRGKRRCVLK